MTDNNMDLHITPYVRKAQYYETDQMGIIHHANYVHWMEEARSDFMEQIGFGYEKAVEAGIDFVLTGITCDYKSMVRFGESVSIESSITKLNPILMTVSFTMTDVATGQLRCIAESRHCCFDNNKKRPAALSRVLPDLYETFMRFHQSTTKEAAE